MPTRYSSNNMSVDSDSDSNNSEIDDFFGFLVKGSDDRKNPENINGVTYYKLDHDNTPVFYRNAETTDEFKIATSGTPEKTGKVSMRINKTAFFSPIKLENEGRSTGSYSGELMGFKVKKNVVLKLIALDKDQPVLFEALKNKHLGSEYVQNIKNNGYLSNDDIDLIKNDKNLENQEIIILICEHFPYNEKGIIIPPTKDKNKSRGVRNSVGYKDRLINAILMYEYGNYFDGYAIKQLPTIDGGYFHSEFTLNDFAREENGTVQWLKIEQTFIGEKKTTSFRISKQNNTKIKKII